jgi:hypothetical protein
MFSSVYIQVLDTQLDFVRPFNKSYINVGCPVERLGMDENWLDVTQVFPFLFIYLNPVINVICMSAILIMIMILSVLWQ